MGRTALYEKHVEHGGKIVDFFGWELPIQYSSILEEHHAVREKAGLFDVSHMGEITFKGKEAEAAIRHLITNDIAKIVEGQIMYSPMCYENGTVVDDLLVYKFSNTDYLVIVNASNIDKDYEWMVENTKEFDVEVVNQSEVYAQIAIQGPLAEEILQKVVDIQLRDIKFYHFDAAGTVGDSKVIISRTGYTGEDGFEVYVEKEKAPVVWETIFNVGEELGLVPCGLGARDSLRFEVALPLYGHELSDQITPLEAGLKFFVKLEDTDFIGREGLKKQLESGVERKIVGIEMTEKGIPRADYKIYCNDEEIGVVTTGGVAPSLNKNIALGLVDSGYAALDTEVELQIRKKRVKGKIIKKPFYNKRYKK